MLKKFIKGLVVGGALLGMVSTAQAATYDINIYGASAQHKFWLNLAPSWLTDAAGGNCASAEQASYNKKHGIARGNNCNIPGGSGDDEILFRYSSRASYAGIVAINDGAAKDMVDAGTCNFGTGACTGLAPVQVNLAASDVAWDDFTQATIGFEDGNLANDVYSDTPDYEAPDPGGVDPVYPTSAPDGVFNPIVVPFGFVVNDSVCKFRCVKPHVWSDADGNQIDGPLGPDAYNAIDTFAHKAYPHDMWQCDPNKSVGVSCSDPVYTTWKACVENGETWTESTTGRNEQCVGYYKCVDTDADDPQDGAETTCQGGPRAGLSCSTATDCPDVDNRAESCDVDGWVNLTEADCTAASGTWAANPDYLLNTRCEAMPIDNVTNIMVGQIFSGQVKDWCDFGPYYCCSADGRTGMDTAVFAAMRHGGSGTHATMDNLMKPYKLAEDDAYDGNLMVGDASYPQGYNRIHYTSSSDLTKAVVDFAGGIGYVDADKLLGFKKIYDGMADGPTAAYDEADGIVGAHLVKLCGAEPTRQNIVWGEYGFWAAQHVYYDSADFPAGPLGTLRGRLESYSSNEANLTVDTLGNPANFWAAQGEMKVKTDKVVGVTKKIVVRK